MVPYNPAMSKKPYPIIAFPFRLPFQVALTPETPIMVPLSGKWQDHRRGAPYVRLRFAQLPVDEVKLSTLPLEWLTSIRSPRSKRRRSKESVERENEDLPQPQFVETIADAETANSFMVGENHSDLSQAAFERCLSALNRFLHAYIVTTENSSVYFVMREALDPLQLVDYRRRSGVSEGVGEAQILHENLPRVATFERLNESQQTYLGHALRNEKYNHPMDAVRIWLVRANRASDVTGDYEQAVLYLETSAEALLWSVLYLLHVEDGKDSVWIETEFQKKQQLSQMLAALGKRLGGDWNGQGSGPVGHFWRNLYEVRNLVAHKAQHVTELQLRDAYLGYEALEGHVHSRVLERRYGIPRLAVGVFGAEGLRKQGLLDAKMVSCCQRLGSERGPFWAPVDQRPLPPDASRSANDRLSTVLDLQAD